MGFEKFATQKDASPYFIGRSQAIFELALTAFKAGRLGEVETLIVRGCNLSMEYDLLPAFIIPTEKDPNAVS